MNDVKYRYSTEWFLDHNTGIWTNMYRFVVETDYEIFESQLLEDNNRFDWMYEIKRDQCAGMYVGKPIYRIIVE